MFAETLVTRGPVTTFLVVVDSVVFASLVVVEALECLTVVLVDFGVFLRSVVVILVVVELVDVLLLEEVAVDF
jgi:hypothetical protein